MVNDTGDPRSEPPKCKASADFSAETAANFVSDLLHEAARALAGGDAIEAFTLVRRAVAHNPELANVPNANLVREALPEMQRRARAQSLAAALQPPSESIGSDACELAGVIEALAEFPGGAAVLDALTNEDASAVRAGLNALSERLDLSPRLAHHLALLMMRAARMREQRDETTEADPYWRRMWTCWLQFLNRRPYEDRRMVLDFLFEQHRRRLDDFLTRGAIDTARRHWNIVAELSVRAGQIAESMSRDIAERGEHFREQLAVEYLRTTREAMRYGVVPEGWRADYEKGLNGLRRLLSLDNGNRRLLTALIEICNEWFVDLYHQSDWSGLRMRVERFTPFALQLARRLDEQRGDWPAGTALAEFWKFRGFVADDRGRKIALYREALRFNPIDSNVRALLAELEPSS